MTSFATLVSTEYSALVVERATLDWHFFDQSIDEYPTFCSIYDICCLESKHLS